jgi:L-ascorbate peroxidase
LDLLTEAKKEIDSNSKGGPITFADLIQFAGLAISTVTILALLNLLIFAGELFCTSASLKLRIMFFFLETAQSALKRSFLDAAIAKCGGNEEKGRTLYSAYGSNGQVFAVPYSPYDT